MASIRKLLPRFSLRTLVIFLLLVTAGVGLWWHWEAWHLVHRLRGHKARVFRIRFSADGGEVVSFDEDGEMRRWNTESGRPVGAPHTVTLRYSGILSPDGSLKLEWDDSVVGPTPVRIRDVGSGNLVRTLKEDHIMHACFSPDGKRVAVGSADGCVRVWNVATGRCVLALEDVGDYVESVSFSSDGSRLAATDNDGDWRIWDAASGDLLCTLPSGVWSGFGIDSISFSPDHRHAVLLGFGDGFGILRRRRPEWWWGVFWLREFWLTAAFAAIFVWSVVRDRRALARTG